MAELPPGSRPSQLAVTNSDVRICADYPSYMFTEAVHNNLGGYGPDKGEQALIFKAVPKSDKRLEDIEMVITNLTAYKPFLGDAQFKNGMLGEFGNIDIRAGYSTVLKAQIRHWKSKKPFVLPTVAMTFFDLDTDLHGRCQEVVKIGNSHEHMLTEHTKIQVTQSGRTLSFKGTIYGNISDNPKHPRTMTKLQKDKSFSVSFKDTSNLYFELGARDGYCPRLFNFVPEPSLLCGKHVSKIVITKIIRRTVHRQLISDLDWRYCLWALPLALLLAGLPALMLWRAYREPTLDELLAKAKERIHKQAERASFLLASDEIKDDDPELQEIVESLRSHKDFVRALCDAPWRDWSAPGKCQVCKIDVDKKTKGLHCAKGGHRICWRCMVKNIDWEMVALDEQQKLINAAKNQPQDASPFG